MLNQKGGVGKTTTVANIAAALAARGQRVAAIDLDPQAHLTIHLGLEPDTLDAGAYKVLTQSAQFEQELLFVRANLWLLPANINLVGAESELVSVVGREIILREAIEKAQDNFDYLIIDCAPSLGLLTLNALAATEEILIPLQPHFLALQGFGKLLQTVDIVNKRINPKLKVKWVLLCMYDSRASLPSEVKADIQQFLGRARGTACAWAEAQVLPVCIRRNIKLAEAPSYGQTIFEYERNCHGAEDYAKVAEFIHNGVPTPLQPTPQSAPGDQPKDDTPIEIVPDELPSAQPQDESPDAAQAHSQPPAEILPDQWQSTQPIPQTSANDQPQDDVPIEIVPDELPLSEPAEAAQSPDQPPIEIVSIPPPQPRKPDREFIETDSKSLSE